MLVLTDGNKSFILFFVNERKISKTGKFVERFYRESKCSHNELKLAEKMHD